MNYRFPKPVLRQLQPFAASLLVCLIVCPFLQAQDPVGTMEGVVSDASGATVAAHITVTNLDTDASRETTATASGIFRFAQVPIGRYSIRVDADHFATVIQQPVTVNISQNVRLQFALAVSAVKSTVDVQSDASLVDTTTNALGAVVTGREILNLPLNGRNFTQLGLLQSGVAPLTPAMATYGGSLRANQAYAVNGMRPESNNYLVDGSQNVDRLDGAFALKPPVDGIEEFRILTLDAPPEFGAFAGSTTSVVTRSGGNQVHGSAYEFFRNNDLDARNFFSPSVEPLKQNQYGVTAGGPIKKDKLFVFGYYEGFRNRQGVTYTSTVPTQAERSGDFTGLPSPLLNFAKGGIPVPGGKIPASSFSPIGLAVANLYPAGGNVSPTVYTTTPVTHNDTDQTGIRSDYARSANDQYFLRYAWSQGANLNPISLRGSPLPGFPTQDNLNTHSAAIANTHSFSPTLTNAARISFLRYLFDFDQRLNRTPPSAFGFQYASASALGQGPPYFNLGGYSPVGGATSGPRDSAQNTYELGDSLAWTKGKHSAKFGGSFIRTQMNVFQSTVPNGLLIFSSAFPTSDAFANLLLGSPVVFYQGIGDFGRGLRTWTSAVYAQDEWRIKPRFTLNYGLRWEVITPNKEIRNRLNTFVAGVQSTVEPDAPTGILFPGDKGIASGLAPDYDKAFMPRIGFAWDPTGSGAWSIRSGYGIFYDPFSNGINIASNPSVSAAPWAQFDQYTGNINFANPYSGHSIPVPGTFAHPSTILAMDSTARPPYSQNWNFTVQRSFSKDYLLEVKYVGTKGTRLPRNIEADPAIFGPGATSSNADSRRLYAGCAAHNGVCQLATVALLTYGSNSTYQAGQISLSHRYATGFSFNTSYWFSKSLDYLSSINVNNSSGTGLVGENDLAQNPFDLRAEHGPSLFDARHRFVASGTWQLPFGRGLSGVSKVLLQGWQVNVIGSANSGTPFTVYDSANVALQASSPPLSSYFASRPNLIGDPNDGAHTVNHWIGRSAFVRLSPVTQAGQFGNAGRNIARGPAAADLDASLMKNFAIRERLTLQFRAESFNVANHPNFSVPVADLASQNFGRILSAGPARLTQFGLKVLF
jgi:Carboxypeptidase regulatory-like domain